MGSRAGMEPVAKRKSHCCCRESKPGRPAPSSVTILTELSRLLVSSVSQSYFKIDGQSVSLGVETLQDS
jgi:hypothetical protein